MTPFESLVTGLFLGSCIGADVMWLYLMNKYANRPVDWIAIIATLVVGLAIGLAIFGIVIGINP